MLDIGDLWRLLRDRFGGVLYAGTHVPNEAIGCVLEFYSVYLGQNWTANPALLHIWDLAPYNDMPVSPKVLASGMLPVLARYAGSRDWPLRQQQAIVIRLIIGTVREVIAVLPGLPDELRRQCRAVETLDAARATAGVVAAGYFLPAVRLMRAAETATDVTLTAESPWMAAADVALGVGQVVETVRWAPRLAAGASVTTIFLQACAVWCAAYDAEMANA
jgi:hypothetical protein